MEKGVFIAVEGIDGSGKTVLCKNLFDHFNNLNKKILLTKEPFDNPLASNFRTIFKDYIEFVKNSVISKNSYFEYLLFASDRLMHIENIIKPSLENGFLVISDRFLDSSIVYQGYLNNLDLNFIKNIYNKTSFGIIQNITIYCKIEVKIAIERIVKRGMLDPFDEIAIKNIYKIKEGYDFIYQNRDDVIILDASQNENILLDSALNKLNIFFKNF